MIVTIPTSLVPASILAFAAQLDDLPLAETYEFDFCCSRWSPLISMLLLVVIFNLLELGKTMLREQLERERETADDLRIRPTQAENLLADQRPTSRKWFWQKY
jgi:hypothetical protein